MKTLRFGTMAAVFLITAGGIALAQGAAESGPPVLAKDMVKARFGGKLFVTSPAFVSGNDLEDKYTQNGENISPPLSWSKGPSGTRSYVVLAEDAGVNRHDPVFHWVLYNVPPATTVLHEGMPADATLDDMGGEVDLETVPSSGTEPRRKKTSSR